MDLYGFIVAATAATTSTPAIFHSVDVGAPVHVIDVALGAVEALTCALATTLLVNQLVEPVVVKEVMLAGTLAATQTEMFPAAPVRDSVSAPDTAKLVPERTNAVATDVVMPPLNDRRFSTAGTEVPHEQLRVLLPLVGLTNPYSSIKRFVLVL
jgi:hypothetical protein